MKSFNFTLRPKVAFLLFLVLFSSSWGQKSPLQPKIESFAEGPSLTLIVTLDPGWEIASHDADEDFNYRAKVVVQNPDINFSKPKFGPALEKDLPELGLKKRYFSDLFQVEIPAKAKKASFSHKHTRVVLYFQSCQNNMCYPPDSVVYRP